MMRLRHAVRAGFLGLVLVPAAVRADVTEQTERGFVSRNVVVMAGSPAAVWKRLITPASWWSPDHTFSGDAANLTIDPAAGGCFCEKLPAENAEPAKPGAAAHPASRGGVEHMRVVYVDHAKALRLTGALGPLQSEAVSATLTVTLKPVEGGTRVIFEYVVGGYMRYPTDKIAAAVDVVMGNQLLALAKLFGPVAEPKAESPAPPKTGGAGLDRNGLLLPRGKVWSLPSGEQPAPPEPGPVIAPLPVAAAPAAPEPAPVAKPAVPDAPLPTAPLQDDLAPSGGAAPAVKPVLAASPAPPPAPRPAKPAPGRRTTTAKPAAPKPAAPGDEPSRDTINSAFDAAFGGAPRPAPNR
jgi:hypothetical protein